jgi:nitrogen PTS system EIIA component
MQLSIRDLTKLLDVTESLVTRWIKQRSLPAQQVGGQYRVNRAELLEWATANNIKVSLELFDRLDAEAETVPSLAEALEVGGVHYQLVVARSPDRVTTGGKDQALRSLVQVLPLPDGVDRELLLRLFLAREASASTAIGDGIAIPHVRNPIVLHVSQPAVTLAFLERPVDFGALDGKPVHVLFSIISPTNRSHLQLLSRLSFALHDGKLREAVVRHAPREEILREVHRVEVGMGAPAAEAGKAAQ